MHEAAAPDFALLQAPAHWRCVEFASDLHLQPSMPRTLAAWQRWLEHSDADALFMLGDLFEAWIGDDAIDGDDFSRECASLLQQASRKRPVHVMHGNRDFLIGAAFGRHTGASLLPDPCVFDFAQRRWLLTHGDALCIDDTAYMAFRAEVRSAAWQQGFLSQTLAQRQQLAASMRAQSRAHQQQRGLPGDADLATVCRWMDAARAPVMIHGHTHRPEDHRIDAYHTRLVLSDWDCDGAPARAEVLRIDEGGWQRRALA
jgi:UDP-2,3-diacylglucosamine hydrolase